MTGLNLLSVLFALFLCGCSVPVSGTQDFPAKGFKCTLPSSVPWRLAIQKDFPESHMVFRVYTNRSGGRYIIVTIRDNDTGKKDLAGVFNATVLSMMQRNSRWYYVAIAHSEMGMVGGVPAGIMTGKQGGDLRIDYFMQVVALQGDQIYDITLQWDVNTGADPDPILMEFLQSIEITKASP